MGRLPAVGELFWVDTWIYADADKKPRRPLVVVQAPRDWLQRVHVITRTSDTDRSGVEHPAEPALGLSENGVFSLKHYRHVEAQVFVPPAVELIGVLPEPYLGAVLTMWENG